MRKQGAEEDDLAEGGLLEGLEALKNQSHVMVWRKAHGSIRIQEGEPNKFNHLVPL